MACRYREDSRRRLARVYATRVATRPDDPTVDPASLGWLAGIIDGEGTVALSHGGTRSPHLRIGITNGSDEILAKIYRILENCGVDFYAKRERRGTTNVLIGTTGALRLHRMLRSYLVRQVAQYDAAVAFMRRRYDSGVTRVYWTTTERAEWEALRERYHKRAKRLAAV